MQLLRPLPHVRRRDWQCTWLSICNSQEAAETQPNAYTIAISTWDLVCHIKAASHILATGLRNQDAEQEQLALLLSG